jgi:hypothetical protein
MKRLTPLIAAAVLIAMLPIGPAHAVTVSHTRALNAGETKTWSGTAKLGANASYNANVSAEEGYCTEAGPGSFYYDPRSVCDYVLISATNPVPDTDADGKLKKNLSITINEFLGGVQATDYDMRLYTTDATASFRGEEVGFSANSSPEDPDEQIVISVETTRTPLVSTKHYLLEIGYFLSPYAVDPCTLPEQVRPNPCHPYKGTIAF